MTEKACVTLDGRLVDVYPGDTLLDVAQRQGVDIPALCHDPRLEPAGACRLCLVEVEGQRRMVPSCATPATPGMVVRSKSEKVNKHRQTLLGLYLTDHPSDRTQCERHSPCELHALADVYHAPTHWQHVEPLRTGRDTDDNRFLTFSADKCILCAKCTRYCEEIEAASAITLAYRGPETTIATVDHHQLRDTDCELCGGCVDICPTGAMAAVLPTRMDAPPRSQLEKVRTTCNYCGVGCQLDLHVDKKANHGRGKVVQITAPPPGSTTNDGNLCVKGRFAYQFIDHPERLTTPLVRRTDGLLHPATWEEALTTAAKRLMEVRDKHGADALGFVSSSRCTVEENYLVQKLSRAVFFTNNVHQCAAT
ncbi:MAG: (2Fe-2S)-binding protein [Myxococcales bacterium]|nr:(2Fe-2S)-binding protein [Myxococcales bacterium]